MHGEHEDRRLLIVQTKPSDEGKSTQRPGAHGEIGDNHVWLVRAVEAETLGES
jgi:hypothetical protein